MSEIEDCAIAVDASYYLQLFLDNSPYHEPLLSALGGLTGIQAHIEKDLDQWAAHRITPLFVFDGQVVVGQDEVSIARGRRANEKTENAWDLYFNNRAEEAVSAFGANSSEYMPIGVPTTEYTCLFFDRLVQALSDHNLCIISCRAS